MKKRILFPTDFSPCANAAFSHALFQADAADAELHILHSVYWDEQQSAEGMPDPDAIMLEMQKVAQVRVTEMVAPQKSKPFEIFEKCTIGPTPIRAIMDYIKENDISLVVMGTHGRRGVSHFLLGSVAEELARMAPCPVITVSDKAEHHELAKVKRILAPIDFSPQSRHALYRARDMAKMHGSELFMLNVVNEFEPGFGSVDSGFELINDTIPRLVEERKTHLEKLYNQMPGESVPHHIEVLVGKVHWRIVNFARQHEIDYIVMATHGYGGFNHLILGSNTERVIRTAPCPVYTMKLK